MLKTIFTFRICILNQGDTEYSDKQCKTCGKTFKNAYKLKRHRASHVCTTKKHKCEECEKKFKSEKGLRNHIKTFHEINTKALTQAQTECDLCGKVFRFHERLKDKIKVRCVHEGKHMFDCAYGVCDKSYKDIGNLKKHIKCDHEGTEFVCNQDECAKDGGGKHFLSAHLLRYHIDKVHKGKIQLH